MNLGLGILYFYILPIIYLYIHEYKRIRQSGISHFAGIFIPVYNVMLVVAFTVMDIETLIMYIRNKNK